MDCSRRRSRRIRLHSLSAAAAAHGTAGLTAPAREGGGGGVSILLAGIADISGGRKDGRTGAKLANRESVTQGQTHPTSAAIATIYFSFFWGFPRVI